MRFNHILRLFVLLIYLTTSYAQMDTTESAYANIPIHEGMALIPGGTFEMGISEKDIEELAMMGRDVPHMNNALAERWFSDEMPRHTVQIDPFYLDKYEVSNAQFSKFIEEAAYDAEGNWQKYFDQDRLDHPVVNVTWNDAQAYAKWAGKRLPSESEWEYAAKGDKNVKWFSWGDSVDATRANYRYNGESFFEGLGRLMGLRKINTKPVGSYKSNGYGLYDLCGNVSEWCSDAYKPYPGYSKDESDFSGKVTRGGNWDSPNAVFIRVNIRGDYEDSHYSRKLGFRCAKSINLF